MFQFDIPARILTVDYFGLSAEFAAQYRRKALLELHDLAYSMHTLGQNLEQGRRERIVAPNVKIISEVLFGVATAIIVIGFNEETSLQEYSCFCTTFGIVAARITSINSVLILFIKQIRGFTYQSKVIITKPNQMVNCTIK